VITLLLGIVCASWFGTGVGFIYNYHFRAVVNKYLPLIPCFDVVNRDNLKWKRPENILV